MAKSIPIRTRLWLILLAVVLVLSGTLAYFGRVDSSELAVIHKYPYTLQETPMPEDGTVSYRYEVDADPDVILAGLPKDKLSKAATARGAVYEFKLKSGQTGRFVASLHRQHCVILVEGKPDSMAVRALRRLGLI